MLVDRELFGMDIERTGRIVARSLCDDFGIGAIYADRPAFEAVASEE